jgi:hypothetical protein
MLPCHAMIEWKTPTQHSLIQTNPRLLVRSSPSSMLPYDDNSYSLDKALAYRFAVIKPSNPRAASPLTAELITPPSSNLCSRNLCSRSTSIALAASS